MAASKTSSVLLGAFTNAAGNTIASSALNLTTAYGAIVLAQVSNGSAAPGAGAVVTVNVSPDGTTWNQWAAGTAGITANTTYSFAWEIPPAAMYVQVVFAGNTTNSVTCAVQAEVLTAI